MKGVLFFVGRAILCLLGAFLAAGGIFFQQTLLGNVSLASSSGEMARDMAICMACVAMLMLGSAIIGHAVTPSEPDFIRRLFRRR